ncbi:MAG TPA: PqqD family protein [Ignavibacteria bacterium]
MKVNKKIALSESGFFFDSGTGDSYSLNPIAVEILGMVKENKSDGQIKKALLEKYEVKSAVFDKAYNEYLDILEKFNKIEE